MSALAADAPVKWVDNLLAQHDLPEVRSARRGVPRGVSWAGVVRIALIRRLHLELGTGVREAVALSETLLRVADCRLTLAGVITLAVDRTALERDLQARLADALESAPRPRRGRPPGRLEAATRTGASRQ